MIRFFVAVTVAFFVGAMSTGVLDSIDRPFWMNLAAFPACALIGIALQRTVRAIDPRHFT